MVEEAYTTLGEVLLSLKEVMQLTLNSANYCCLTLLPLTHIIAAGLPESQINTIFRAAQSLPRLKRLALANFEKSRWSSQLDLFRKANPALNINTRLV